MLVIVRHLLDVTVAVTYTETDLIQHENSDQYTRQCQMMLETSYKSCSCRRHQDLNESFDDNVGNCRLPYTLNSNYTSQRTTIDCLIPWTATIRHNVLLFAVFSITILNTGSQFQATSCNVFPS